MATRSPDEVEIYRSDVKTYNFTRTSFIKREIPVGERGLDKSGQPVTQPWLAQRFSNEAAALQLLAERTAIPVPRLISCGVDENRLWYLETELIRGSVRGDMAADTCRMPQRHGMPNNSGPCDNCADIVRQNAERFVQKTVLPQLQDLRSNRTGLNGFVIPPLWVLEHDKREIWPVKTSGRNEFVFCVNDLVVHNILFDSKSLQVLALVDFEDSGFFPPDIQQWKFSRFEQFGLYEDMELVNWHISLIAP